MSNLIIVLVISTFISFYIGGVLAVILTLSFYTMHGYINQLYIHTKEVKLEFDGTDYHCYDSVRATLCLQTADSYIIYYCGKVQSIFISGLL